MSMDHLYREQSPLQREAKKKQKTGSLWLVKSFQIRQLIFWLLAEMLRCSADAEQAPVDNHLLCSGEARGVGADGTSFILPRMLSLNKGRSAECQALWERRGKLKPSRTALLVRGRAIVVCVLQFHSDGRVLLIHYCVALGGRTSHAGISWPRSLPLNPPPLPSPPLTRSLADMPELMRSDFVVPANNQEK